MAEDFDRAGEDAWMIGGNYDFQRVGPGDLSLFANIVTGGSLRRPLFTSAGVACRQMRTDCRHL
jgi:hypothetical protein